MQPMSNHDLRIDADTKVLVTGASGFLGKFLVKALLRRKASVSVLYRQDCTEFDDLNLGILKGDIARAPICKKACEGMELVFHVAAKAGEWGSYKSYSEPNVQGTQNIIAACQAAGVKRLIFTSTTSVVIPQAQLNDMDESVAIPSGQHFNNYQRTKAIAEEFVIAANDPKGLRTTSIRPSAIWGIGDNHLFPRILKRAQRGKLAIIGDGKNSISIIHVENAAHAHLQAAESENVWGKVYFITDEKPVALWPLVEHVLSELAIPRIKKSISFKRAFVLATVLEKIYQILHIPVAPPLTKYIVYMVGKDRHYNISRAKQDFGYTPIVAFDKALEDSLAYYRAQICG